MTLPNNRENNTWKLRTTGIWGEAFIRKSWMNTHIFVCQCLARLSGCAQQLTCIGSAHWLDSPLRIISPKLCWVSRKVASDSKNAVTCPVGLVETKNCCAVIIVYAFQVTMVSCAIRFPRPSLCSRSSYPTDMFVHDNRRKKSLGIPAEQPYRNVEQL